MIDFLIRLVRFIIVVLFYMTSAVVCYEEYKDLSEDIEETEKEEKLILNYLHPIEAIFLYIFIIMTTLIPLVNCIMAEIYHCNKTYDIIMNIIRKRDKKVKIGG